MYPGSSLGHRDKACWFSCSNIQHRPTSGPVRGLYCNDPARGAGRRAVAGGRLGPGVPGTGGAGTRHDAGRRGAAFGAARARRLARRRVTATPGPPPCECGAGGGARAGDHDRRQKPVLKTWISRLFGICLRKATPARVRSTRARAGTERSQVTRLATPSRSGTPRHAPFVHAHARVAGLALTTLNSALDRRWGRRRRQRPRHSHRGRFEPSCALSAREL